MAEQHLRPSHYTLGELIARLRQEVDHTRRVKVGFHEPHSYRGYYEQLAFELATDVTIAEMLAAAESALGATYQGWKGGDYTMTDYTDVWLVAERGDCGETLGAVFLELMLAPEPATHGQHDQGERRDRQIQAARAVLLAPITTDDVNDPDRDLAWLAGQLVDAVNAAGGRVEDLGDGYHEADLRAGMWTWLDAAGIRAMPDRTVTLRWKTLDEPSDAEARGWNAAVEALRDDERYAAWWKSRPEDEDAYWRRTVRKDLADYLEAVGPGARAKPNVRVEIGGHDVTDSARVTRRGPEAGQDGRGDDRQETGSDEAGKGGSGAEGGPDA